MGIRKVVAWSPDTCGCRLLGAEFEPWVEVDGELVYDGTIDPFPHPITSAEAVLIFAERHQHPLWSARTNPDGAPETVLCSHHAELSEGDEHIVAVNNESVMKNGAVVALIESDKVPEAQSPEDVQWSYDKDRQLTVAVPGADSDAVSAVIDSVR